MRQAPALRVDHTLHKVEEWLAFTTFPSSSLLPSAPRELEGRTMSTRTTCIYDALPSELIMDAIAFLQSKDLAQCMLVSRRLFVLVSAVLRQKTGALLGQSSSDLGLTVRHHKFALLSTQATAHSALPVTRGPRLNNLKHTCHRSDHFM